MMNHDIRQYARVGLVHHMLYAESLEDSDAHADTLEEFIRREDMETFECCLPYGERRRERLIPQIRNCGKEDIAFAAHLFPIRKISFSTLRPSEQAQARMIVKDMIDQAAAIGASDFIFASGGPGSAHATEAHYRAFAGFCRWLCGELKPHGITAVMEMFDTDVAKKFLYGSSEQCVALVESLRPEIDNFGLGLDLAHVPLMRESFQHAIRTATPHIKRVHLGNCVLRDRNHPRWGDTHPPIGFDGGEIDVPQIAEALRCLLDVGYLDRRQRRNLLIEMTPWPGRSVEDTIQDNLGRLHRAWEQVIQENSS